MKAVALLVSALALTSVVSAHADDRAWNPEICPKGVEENLGKLPLMNPYDSEGRCFRYMGRSLYLLDRTHAIFSLLSDSAPFSMIDFGKSSAPVNFFSGVVLGKGAYSYTTAVGGQKIVFSFVNVPRLKASERETEKAPSK